MSFIHRLLSLDETAKYQQTIASKKLDKMLWKCVVELINGKTAR